ncbi:MAG: hypothetical protein IJC45_10455 [Clostridia bacterium]|nr:hypothetical protein [Clostridia bacterium]
MRLTCFYKNQLYILLYTDFIRSARENARNVAANGKQKIEIQQEVYATAKQKMTA